MARLKQTLQRLDKENHELQLRGEVSREEVAHAVALANQIRRRVAEDAANEAKVAAQAEATSVAVESSPPRQKCAALQRLRATARQCQTPDVANARWPSPE